MYRLTKAGNIVVGTLLGFSLLGGFAFATMIVIEVFKALFGG